MVYIDSCARTFVATNGKSGDIYEVYIGMVGNQHNLSLISACVSLLYFASLFTKKYGIITWIHIVGLMYFLFIGASFLINYPNIALGVMSMASVWLFVDLMRLIDKAEEAKKNKILKKMELSSRRKPIAYFYGGMHMNKIDNGTIARLVVLTIVLINTILEVKGMSLIPFDEAYISEFVSIIALIVTSIWTTWKNNNFTKTPYRRRNSRTSWIKAKSKSNSKKLLKMNLKLLSIMKRQNQMTK